MDDSSDNILNWTVLQGDPEASNWRSSDHGLALVQASQERIGQSWTMNEELHRRIRNTIRTVRSSQLLIHKSDQLLYTLGSASHSNGPSSPLGQSCQEVLWELLRISTPIAEAENEIPFA